MSTPVAVLTFPWRGADAARALAGSRGAALVPLLLPAVVGVFLQLRGADAADAWVAGLAALLIVLGLGLGGLVGSFPARTLLAQPFRAGELLAPCLVFATWTPLLFLALLGAAKLVGAEEKAALFAGIITLIWGIVTGIGVVGGDDAEDYGRALVASCLGLAVALVGMVGALMLIQAQLLLAVPAPVAADCFQPGDLLLVRREQQSKPETIILLRDARSPEAMLARARPQGGFEPIGTRRGARERGDWRQVGRVFFRCGGAGGGRPVPNRPKPLK